MSARVVAPGSRPPARVPIQSAGMTWQQRYDETMQQLQKVYFDEVEPVEVAYRYDAFSPHDWFAENLKAKKPMVVVLGPFSAGKSSLINYLLGGTYLHTGAEPTTAQFNVLMWGSEVNHIGGRVLVSSSTLPYKGLSEFGTDAIEALKGLQCPADVLRSVTIVDTPGVLESATDIHARSYDYIGVQRWFVERADLVFVMFDPSKLDAGEELRKLFLTFRGKESRLRIILNKADTIEPATLLRVYGSLFWNLSNMIHSSEPPRVFISSFWERPYVHQQFAFIFDDEKAALLYDMLEVVPLQSLDTRISNVMSRAKTVQIVSTVAAYLHDKLPMFGKDSAQKEYARDIEKHCEAVHRQFRLVAADFPSAASLRAYLARSDLSKVPGLKSQEKKGSDALLRRLERALEVELPALLAPIHAHSAVNPRQFRSQWASLLGTPLPSEVPSGPGQLRAAAASAAAGGGPVVFAGVPGVTHLPAPPSTYPPPPATVAAAAPPAPAPAPQPAVAKIAPPPTSSPVEAAAPEVPPPPAPAPPPTPPVAVPAVPAMPGGFVAPPGMDPAAMMAMMPAMMAMMAQMQAQQAAAAASAASAPASSA